jgi:hypothetical protein
VVSLSPDRHRLSWSCSTLQSIHPKLTSTRIGLDAALMSFVPKRVDFRAFASLRTPEPLNAAPDLLSWACALLQSAPKQRAARAKNRSILRMLPSLRFRPLQRVPTRKSSLVSLEGQLPTTLDTCRFSQPRGASLLRVCCPYFRADPLVGFSLQSFVPLAQPYAVSSACALLSLANSPLPQHLV